VPEAQQIEQQAESLKAAWHRIAKQDRRIEDLQSRCDWQQYIINELRKQVSALTDPVQRAEAHFGKGQ